MSNQSKIIVGIIVLLVIGYSIFVFDVPYREVIDDFQTCAAAGNPIMESYPRQCRDKKGNLFVEVLGGGVFESDMIHVTEPLKNAVVTSPLSLSGEARGNWYFEASAPVQILGADGVILGESFVTAQGDWMTENFVPFTGTVTFDPGKNVSGIIRFKKDNPSGLPEFDEQFDVPVMFIKIVSGETGGGQKVCKATGCSGQICSDEEGIVSTCEYRSEYACYKTATCERQPSGACGWTETVALKACLSNPPNLE